MAEISRRNFLRNTGTGIAAVGLIAVAPSVMVSEAGAATKTKVAARPKTMVRPASTSETVVAHIPNPRTGDIHFLVGSREVIHRDRALVARILRDV